MSEQNAIIEFLRYCLVERTFLLDSVDDIDWNKILVWAEEQAIVGVVFNGIQKADKCPKIPTEMLFKWIGYANLIESQNRLLNKQGVELAEYLGLSGIKTCILKGQGNALMYPKSLLRTPGNIDVWVKGKTINDKICVNCQF